MELGKAIRISREQRGYTRSELADKAKLSLSYVSLLENSKRDPNLSKIEKIAEALDIPVSILFFLAADKSEIESISSELAEKMSLLTLKLLESKRNGTPSLST